MSKEFIIGTIIGLIGIIPVINQTVKWVKKPQLSNLMIKLVDNGLSTKTHRKVLQKMNVILLRSGKHISSEYIKNFVLNKRGKEAVFTELCMQNDWEPTKELCEMFMNGDYPSIRKKYWDMKNAQAKREAPAADAILKVETVPAQPTGKEIVYLSELLKERFPDCFERLTSTLKKHNVEYRLLKGTKDIWCRDYMPIQTESGKLIQFKYDPSYLKGKKEWEESRPNVKEICRQNNINATFSDINLDGGNVLICDGRAIISDRFFSENPTKDKDFLVNELSKLLECEIIIIPAQNGDYTGHADGMVRFVNRNTILGNRMADEFKYWQKGMQKVLETYNLTYIDVPFFEDMKDSKHPDSAIGIYVNYLEVNDLIVMPVFGREEDAQAIEIIQKAFPNKQIETIDYNDVAKEGGLLNCTTWVVK
ncbi:MAG: agmatine deiminase family protein [Bacteroidales bacterium]|nr:agmatine deiminase family protein [Bacteroidales bacterium]